MIASALLTVIWTVSGSVHPTVPPSLPSAGEGPAWIAYIWVIGMIVIVGLVVWMAVTGRLFRRNSRPPS